VKPFVKSNKNDFVDAEAIAEAVERKNMRFVPIKTNDQLDLQAIHRVRDRLISRRTAVINQLRAFLLERGMVFAKTPSRLRAAMPEILRFLLICIRGYQSDWWTVHPRFISVAVLLDGPLAALNAFRFCHESRGSILRYISAACVALAEILYGNAFVAH
jgi:hypothetical protein